MFTKGDPRINRNGRKPGLPNRTTPMLKETISRFLNSNWEQIERDFAGLEPRERIQLYERLLGYILAKPRELNVDLQLERLSDEQLDEITERLIAEYNG